LNKANEIVSDIVATVKYQFVVG